MKKKVIRHIERCDNGWKDNNCNESDCRGWMDGLPMQVIGEIGDVRIYQCPNCKTIKFYSLASLKTKLKK